MNSETRNKIEELWSGRKHGFVKADALTYEVFAEEALRKIKVLSSGKYLPVEFYSLEAFFSGRDKILSMAGVLKDSRLASLRQVFSGSFIKNIRDDQTSLIDPQVKFETTFYPFYNKHQQLLVVVVRPSGAIYYQRLTSPDQLSYTLANQVGFLEVLKEVNGVYTSPDGLLEFKFSGDKLEVIKDLTQ